ncbi:MAG TPA: NnrS family protein [Stellaceae bacterium]
MRRPDIRTDVTAIPRYRPHAGPTILSAGFRPFFLVAALWAALAVPLWLAFFAGGAQLPSALPPAVWHVHEMVFGYGAATVAGFLLTAIPNWTGRMPLQGGPLGLLVLLWAAGRAGVLLSARIGPGAAAILDLAFPAVFLAVVAREILAGRNWRNLPMLAALSLLLLGNLLVHLDAVGVAATAAPGNRLGIATLLMLISFVGGRIIPSFTRNWLAKEVPEAAAPAIFGGIDRAALAFTAVALAAWVAAPEGPVAPWAELAAGLALGVRLLRWRGGATWREPLVWVLHLGYGWLALGFLLLALDGWAALLPQTTALHALTVGAIGTMTLAVMTRASLGHTGRPLAAGSGTTAIYVLVTLAAVLRLLAPLGGTQYLLVLALAGAAWSGAFGLFVLLYLRPLALPRVKGSGARPI